MIEAIPAATSSSEVNPSESASSAGCHKARVDLGDITPHNIKLLKKVNQVVFPVVYHDNFYKDVLEAGELAKLAFFNDIVVGAVCCRVDNAAGSSSSTAATPAPAVATPADPQAKKKLYIMTLGCLAPYRRLGVGSKMVEHVLNIVAKDGNYESVFLHVQVNNEGAINFYRNFGFDIVETKQNYYKRIDPADAYVLEKKLPAGGGSGSSTNGTSS